MLISDPTASHGHGHETQGHKSAASHGHGHEMDTHRKVEVTGIFTRFSQR